MTARSAAGGDIVMYSGGAPQRVLSALLPAFERTTGHRVVPTYEIVGRIQERLARGERPDLILLPQQLLAEIGKAVPFRPGGNRLLARTGIGVIVRDDVTPPDVSDVAAVRTMLRQAKAIALADPHTPTGRHLDGVLTRCGIADALNGRLMRQAAIHGGGALVASGQADLGLYLVSEVQHIAGIRVAGLLPPALQSHVVYAAAIPQSGRPPDAALALIRFLTAADHAACWEQGGFEPA